MDLSVAADASAAIRKSTSIAAQPLSSALQALAKDRGFQLVYVSDDVSLSNTSGASGELTTDEGPRTDTSLEKMAGLAPLRDGGRMTAAVSSQLSDAASAVLVASENAVRRFGLTPRARVHHLSVRGDDPVLMLTAPIRATHHALQRTGLRLDDIDLVEINEAFASVVLAWQQDTGADLERVNVNGGAIALGHPIGASGARILTTLLYAMQDRDAHTGLATLCLGGGNAVALSVERVN